MSAPLPVELNRRSIHSVEAPDEFETSDSFDIELTNHDEAVHVHIHLDDELSTIATIPAGNHFVDRESTASVPVTVNVVDEPVRGKLKLVTGYGAETSYVTVTVTPTTEESPTVEVDESLSKPQARSTPSSGEALADALEGRGPVIAVAVAAVLVALLVGLYLQTVAVLVGVGVVVGAAIAALVFALR